MTSIFNTRKLDKDFGQGTADLVQLIDSYKGDVTDSVMFNLSLARKLKHDGVLELDSRGNGWSPEWHINYRYLLDNGYFSAHGESLVAAGEQMQREYFAAVKSGSLSEYYAKWGNDSGREYIIVP